MPGLVIRTLYLIEILHQTTTAICRYRVPRCCILLKFYIKPQPALVYFLEVTGCILLKFYIKPQHMHKDPEYIKVVSY